MIKLNGAEAFGVYNFLQQGLFNKIDLTILGVRDSLKLKKTFDAIAAVSVEISKDFNQAVELTQKTLITKYPLLTNELTELFKSQNLFMSYQVFYDKLPSESENHKIFYVAKEAKQEIDKAINELKNFWSDALLKEHTLHNVNFLSNSDKLARAIEAKLEMRELGMIAFLFEDDIDAEQTIE